MDHADQLISAGSNGEIVNLLGNVHFTHENADLFSQRATWYREAGLIQFNDSVTVKDDNRVLSANIMTYYRRDKRITAQENVVLKDNVQNVVLYCQKADYFRGSRRMEAVGNPHLIINPDDTTRMDITAKRMTYLADEGRGTATDSVVIHRQNMTATGGLAQFYKNPERAVLMQNPEIIQNENQLTGDTISMFTSNRKLERLYVQGDAKALYKVMPDTLIKDYTTAELTGRDLEAYFRDDKIEWMISRFNATSTYAPAVTDTLIAGKNNASGDSITLYFENSAIKRVFISGGAQGEYIEPKLSSDGTPYYDTTHYSANVIDYTFDSSEIKLENNGVLRFKDMALNAGDIRYNTNTRILIAEGIGTDSTGGVSQTPVLKQGADELFGQRMSYNLDTKKGQVRMARTKYEGGYYTGQAIRQASDDVLFVSQGDYTSCDVEDDPHYHFHSNRMKMIGKDKIVARPVIMYIGQLPVFAVPYYVFPIRKGRHSGFLTFEIGNFERGQRFIRNLGYYWAASQYWDLESSLDFYESSRVILNSNLRYNLRYVLNGTFGINYSRESSWVNFNRRIRNRWRINFTHNHIVSPSVKVSASGTFISDKNFIADNIFNPADRLERTIRSNAFISKEWKSRSMSLNAALDQSWNLDTDFKEEHLPSLSFSYPSRLLIPDPATSKKKTRIRPDEISEPPRKRFYHSIYYSFNTSAQNYRRRSKNTSGDFTRRDFQTIDSRSGISSPQNILGFLTVSPGMNFTHTLYRLEPSHAADSLGLKTGQFIYRATYNLGASVNTKVYGTIRPNIFGITGLRHVMKPSANYTFTPKITKNKSYMSYTGVGAGSNRSKTMTFSLDNLFQAKYRSGKDEKKIDLFSLTFSSNYNFTATRNKLGMLSTSLRTLSLPKFDMTLSTQHSFYNLDGERRPLLKPRLTNLTVASNFRTGYHPGKSGSKEKDEGDTQRPQDKTFGKLPSKAGEFSDIGIDLVLSHSYTINKSGATTTKSQWINISSQFQPTKNWRFSYDARYNLQNKRIEGQSLNIGRDLHCWEAIFSWVPSGNIAGYYVRISIKSLPDIKLEKSEGGLRSGYF